MIIKGNIGIDPQQQVSGNKPVVLPTPIAATAQLANSLKAVAEMVTQEESNATNSSAIRSKSSESLKTPLPTATNATPPPSLASAIHSEQISRKKAYSSRDLNPEMSTIDYFWSFTKQIIEKVGKGALDVSKFTTATLNKWLNPP